MELILNINITISLYSLLNEMNEKATIRIFLLTSVTKVRFMRKLDTQTMRTNISRLFGTRNNFGNKSLTVVIKLSTITNWRQNEMNKVGLGFFLGKKKDYLSNKTCDSCDYMCINSQ